MTCNRMIVFCCWITVVSILLSLAIQIQTARITSRIYGAADLVRSNKIDEANILIREVNGMWLSGGNIEEVTRDNL